MITFFHSPNSSQTHTSLGTWCYYAVQAGLELVDLSAFGFLGLEACTIISDFQILKIKNTFLQFWQSDSNLCHSYLLYPLILCSNTLLQWIILGCNWGISDLYFLHFFILPGIYTFCYYKRNVIFCINLVFLQYCLCISTCFLFISFLCSLCV